MPVQDNEGTPDENGDPHLACAVSLLNQGRYEY